MDRIAGMEAFAAVVETGGFQSAARQLGVSRALISKRVAGLEQAMGVQLLRRTTRKLSVTGPGEDFYERCRRILAEFHEAAGELAVLQQEPSGVLKVNGPMSFGQLHLAAAMVEFMCDHPKIRMQLALTDRFVDVVEEGYDVVLRIGAMRDSSLIARRLCPIRRVLCASPEYLRAAGVPETPAEVGRHRLLQYGWPTVGQRWQLVGPDGESALDVTATFCVNNGDVLKAAARAGLGIALLPTFLCGDELRSGALARVLPHHEGRPIALHALWPESRLMPSRLRRFIDFLAERFGEGKPPWDDGLD
ncbi:MAG: LysR family transcriptional regulator [Geminicoccaceae bacterium]